MATLADYGIVVEDPKPGNNMTLCPRCSHDRKKSDLKCLSVDVERGLWNCFHCNWKGKVHDAVVDAEREKMIAWFKARSISEKTVMDAGITSDRGWIKIPYTQNWREINAKYRFMDEKKWRSTPDGQKSLYGIDNVRKDAPFLVWVEGEIDALALIECGFTDVVSVPDGAPSPGSADGAKLSVLEDPKIEWFIKQIPTHIIAVDEDAPGNTLRDALVRRLGFEKCKVVSWSDLDTSESAKDANEFLMKYGPEKTMERIAKAKDVPVEGIYYAKDVVEDMYREYQVGVERGLSTGIYAIDHLWTVRPKEFSVIHGTPGSGKSKFALRVAVNMAKLHDWKFAFFPAESLPVSRFYNEIVEFYCEQPIVDADGVKMDQKKYFRAVEWVQRHFSCILPEEDPTLDSILSRSEVQIRRWGANAVVIDPWTEIYVQQQRNENRSEYIERALTKVTRFTKANNIHFFVVAHPAKPKDGAYGTKVPHPSDIAGSQMWYNKPDCIICPHRKDRTNTGVELHVQKIRFREVGEYGMVNMVYNKWTGIYSPAYD